MKEKIAKWWKDNKDVIKIASSQVFLAGSSIIFGYELGKFVADRDISIGLATMIGDGFIKTGQTVNGEFTEITGSEFANLLKQHYKVK